MEKLVKEVSELVEREYGRASALHGCTTHSPHESYGLIKEEFEEAEEALRIANEHLRYFWHQVRHDAGPSDMLLELHLIQKYATLAASEMVQVAQVAKKSAISVCDPEALKELTGGAQDEVCGH